MPEGWTRGRWIERLRKLAVACEAVRPDRAAKHRRDADELEGQEETEPQMNTDGHR